MPDFNFDRLPAETKKRIETYARRSGISLSEATEALVIEAIAQGGLQRVLEELDRELEREVGQAKGQILSLVPALKRDLERAS